MGFDINDYVGSGLFEGGRVVFRNPRFTRIPEYRDGQETLLLVDLLNVDEGGELTDQRFGLGEPAERPHGASPAALRSISSISK